MNRQSIYQQLRSHLAYLGLPAAAEALPEQLEKSPPGRHRPYRVHRGAAADRGGDHQSATLEDADEVCQPAHALDAPRL